jgi:polysaccharide deacetylase 2 family uncharacterized protein YibQ
MAKPSPKSSPSFRGTIVLTVAALVMFAIGEALVLTRTDFGWLAAARYLHVGDEARVTQIIGKHIRHALEVAGVPQDSIRQSVRASGRPGVRWRVGLTPHASLLQVHYAIAQVLQGQGATILSGREEVGRHSETIVTLLAGLPGRALHEVELVRFRAARDAPTTPGVGRIAIVVFGFGDDPKSALRFFDVRAPFAVALPPGHPWSGSVFQAARERQREIVLHLPLEPLDYPRVQAGPGAILVTMSSARISSTVRRYLDQAGPVTAVANLMGSLATQDMAVMTAIYRELRRQGLPFLEVTPSAGSVCKSLAADLGVAYDRPDAVLDAEARSQVAKALDARWKQVLESTRRRGQSIVMVRATDLTHEWLPVALTPKRLDGVEVVPLTALLRRPIAL